MYVYLLSYNPFVIDQQSIVSILSNKLVIQEWLFAFPGTVYIKTAMDLKRFRELINLSINGNSFLITIVTAVTQDGSMPFDIWTWISSASQSYFSPMVSPPPPSS